MARFTLAEIALFALLIVAGGAIAAQPPNLRGQALQPPQPAPPSTQPAPGQPTPAASADTPAPGSAGTIPARHPAVEMIPTAPPATVVGRKSSYSFKLSGGDWLDTGVLLNAGDHVQWSASGTLKIGDGREAGPEGSARGWKDLIRQFPSSSANVGAVIARIGGSEAVPFAVDTKKDEEVSQDGHLFLAVNLSPDLTATGNFEVKVKLLSPSKPQAASVKNSAVSIRPGALAAGNSSAGNARGLQNALSPALFSDIPRRVGDQQGNPGDMVNFALIGSEDQVRKSFAAAGWVEVDKTTQDAILHGLLATLEHRAYVEMPMSTLYLFGRSQDLSYARAVPLEVAAIRHHLRVWKTEKTVDGQPMWVGSATHDNGFEKDQRNGQVTHHIDANIDEERDFIQKSFAAAGVIAGAAYVLPENPLQTARTATGGSFESDGRIVVMELK